MEALSCAILPPKSCPKTAQHCFFFAQLSPCSSVPPWFSFLSLCLLRSYVLKVLLLAFNYGNFGAYGKFGNHNKFGPATQCRGADCSGRRMASFPSNLRLTG